MDQVDQAPTTLGELRSFLDRQGAAPPPWTSGEQALDALLALLEARRDDEAFWAGLAPLVRRLEDAAVRPERITGSEVLPGATLDAALAALRRRLPAAGGPAPRSRSWSRGLVDPTALLGFALLGLAAACDSKDSPSGDASCAEAESAGVTDSANAETYCALVEIIQGANITDSAEINLLECLPALGPAQRASLLDEFSNLSEEELAARLEQIAWDEPCYEDHGGSH